MGALDLYADDFPHGTAAGYLRGCRGGACPMVHEGGISCKEARTRAAGDAVYQRRVAGGMTPVEIREADERDREAAAARDKEAKRVARGGAPREVILPGAVQPIEKPVKEALAPRPAPPVAPIAKREPKWSVRKVWAAFAPDGTMHGPFVDQEAAFGFAGQRVAEELQAKKVRAEEASPAASSSSKRVWRAWTEQEIQTARDLHSTGLSDSAIARELGRSQGPTSAKLRRLGLAPNVSSGPRLGVAR